MKEKKETKGKKSEKIHSAFAFYFFLDFSILLGEI